MTKTVFACLVFAPVFPLAVWICVASLGVSYWTDKYLFMTVWKTPQPTGNSGSVAKLARRHLALAVLAHCLFALYYYSGWPFDSICRFQVLEKSLDYCYSKIGCKWFPTHPWLVHGHILGMWSSEKCFGVETPAFGFLKLSMFHSRNAY